MEKVAILSVISVIGQQSLNGRPIFLRLAYITFVAELCLLEISFDGKAELVYEDLLEC